MADSVLVTGSAGFIGSHLVERLTRLRELLGWTPEKTLDDMIEDVMAHCRETAPAA